jgi:hypothetical protein
VTLSTLLCGFYPVLHAVLYIMLQVGGGWGPFGGQGLGAMIRRGCWVLHAVLHTMLQVGGKMRAFVPPRGDPGAAP